MVIFSFPKPFQRVECPAGLLLGGTTCIYQEASVIFFINIIINSPKLMSLSKVTTFPAGVIFYHLPNKRIEMSLTSKKKKKKKKKKERKEKRRRKGKQSKRPLGTLADSCNT